MSLYVYILFINNIFTYHSYVITMDNELLNEIDLVKNNYNESRRIFKYAVNNYINFIL